MVARPKAGHPGADLADDAGALMAQNGRKHPFRVGTRQREGVRMADAGGHNLDKHLAGARTVEIDFHDFKGLAGFHCNCGAGFHHSPPSP